MKPKEYQRIITEISQTYPDNGRDKSLMSVSTGLFEECGEVASLIKRYFRGDVPDDLERKLKMELGDVIAQITLIANMFNLDLEEILLANADKLEKRRVNNTLTGEGSDR